PLVRWHDGDSARAFRTPGEAGRPRAPAARPSGALWGLPRAAQPPAGGDPSHPTPTGAGRGGGAPWHPLLALGPAVGPRLWAGDAHLSVLRPGLPAPSCRHHPAVSDHAYLAASPTHVRPTAHCTRPLSPRDSRVRLSPRPSVHAPWRRPLGAVRAESGHCRVPSSLPCLPPPAVPRPAPPEHPGDAPRTSPARLPAGAGSCIQRRCSVQAAGCRRCAPADTGAKIPLDLPIRIPVELPIHGRP